MIHTIMRPEILFPLFKPVSTLAGVGPRTSALITKVAGSRVIDLCWHLPAANIDRRVTPNILAVQDGAIATLIVTILKHLPARSPGMPYKVTCYDSSGELTLVFFNPRKEYLESILPSGNRRLVSGKITYYNGAPQMTHPDHVLSMDEKAYLPEFEPVYSLTNGLTSRKLRQAVHNSISICPVLPEWLNPLLVSKEGWPTWQKSLLALHNPDSLIESNQQQLARRRLAYDEILANQLALSLTRRHNSQRLGHIIPSDAHSVRDLENDLPFSLTKGQWRAITEIRKDLKSKNIMLRLLQGDVGSGKTVVAFLAMTIVAKAGYQSILLVPTEILAQQHFDNLSSLCNKAGLNLDILTRSTKGKIRASTLERLSNGKTNIIIGTHALLQDTVGFRRLGLVVVDEQHRFGVHQRIILTEKGENVDVLVMSATPIPRTLMLTAYADMDVSLLDQKPRGRQKIITKALPVTKIDRVIERLKNAVLSGAQAFWICPLISESDQLNAVAAEERYAELQKSFKKKVGILHGRMTGPEKESMMKSFLKGQISILVATTVVEVGVDVPGASIIVIENAERFGLAQLHQLRGRIGRNEKLGSCLLLYAEPLSQIANARINTLKESDDGFYIAEEDLRLRGSGDLLGIRQSGLPTFRLADIGFHQDLMPKAKNDVASVLKQDPNLTSFRGRNLRLLLHLFEKETAVHYVRSG